MSKLFKSAAFVGVLSSAALAFIALPLASEGASAAAKKKAATSAMKGAGKSKGGAAKSGGKTGDPLNAAAGKKM